MVVQLDDGKVYVISSMEDIKELIDYELYKAIVELTNNKYNIYEDKLESEICELERDIDDLEDEVNSYDNSCYSMRSSISEAVEHIERLVNYIFEANVLDRDKIIKDLNGISVNLEECEGY